MTVLAPSAAVREWIKVDAGFFYIFLTDMYWRTEALKMKKREKHGNSKNGRLSASGGSDR